jgi:flagellar biosynthesis protein FlhA
MTTTAPNPGILPNWMHQVRRFRGLIVPVGFVSLLAVLLVPLPSAMLDVLIALNIALSIIILLTTVYMNEPLDFSAFPSLLLAATLYRLVLNIASTRLVLTADASSPEEAMHVAGHVIAAFGNFVAGDSLFVGVIIFLILVIVQFIVVSKGATRISEVAARFTLDAMPGKQMAIDSDLNAGVIDEKEARRRRARVGQEADFFGAMDGASKFVRGDAIAGIIITAVNILGGFAVGMLQKGWEAGKTAEVFTKLTIGDGLTSQIPALVVSIASALIVTRSGSKAQLGDELADQMVSQPRGLIITGFFLLMLALTPLPTIPLVVTAVALFGIAFAINKSRKATVYAEQEVAAAAAKKPVEPPQVESLLKVDTLELEVGHGLVGLVDAGSGGDLLERISAVRRQLALEYGLVMPPVRIRDNVQLDTSAYRFKIRGNPVAEGLVRPGKLMAMDSGIASGTIDGEATTEPAFGLAARWIEPSLRGRAEAMNYTVVEPTAVMATHLTEMVKTHADELLTREEVGNLLEECKKKAAKLVEETVPAILKPTELQKLLQNLLRERVPIRDLETVLETVAEWGPKTKDLEVLTEYVRNGLRRTICNQYASVPTGAIKPKLVCVTLDPTIEDQINSFIDRGPAGTVVNMPARAAARFADQIARGLRLVTDAGHMPVVIASPQVRSVVRQVLEPHVPGVAVLGYNEIAGGIEVESLALVTPAEEQTTLLAA